MIDVAADLRACIGDGFGETFQSSSGSFVGQFRDEFQAASVGNFEVETVPASIIAVTADLPSGLVKGSRIDRANGEAWIVSRFERESASGSTVVVLRK